MSAAVAAAAIETQAPAGTEQAAVETTEPKAAPAKPAPSAKLSPEEARAANIEKFAKKMNSEAEKDGVEVDAPPNERRAKPGPKPGAKKQPSAQKPAAEAAPSGNSAEQPAAAPPKRTRVIDDAPQDARGSAEEHGDDSTTKPTLSEDDEADDKPEPRANLQLKAKARLRHGDVDKAIRLAFGDLKTEEFDAVREHLTRKLEPNSKRWVDLRKHEAAAKTEIETKMASLRQSAETLHRDFAPLVEARKAMKEGRRAEAFKLAFGEDINDFQRAALREELSADTASARLKNEVETLRRQLDDVRNGRAAPDPEVQAQRQRQDQSVAIKRGQDAVYDALQQSDDAQVREWGKRRQFVEKVWELRLKHFDPTTKTTIPYNIAAEIARDEVRAMLHQWSNSDGPGGHAPNAESPALAGNEPVRPTAPGRVPNPSHAASGGISTKRMTTEERIRAYARAMGG